MQIRSVGIIGYGSFGALTHRLFSRFAPHIRVLAFDAAKRSDGTVFFPLKEVAAADVLILAVPISAFEDVLRTVVPLSRKDSILVDVATVKMHTVGLLRKLAKGRRYVAAHPVWGPESYRKKRGDVSGFRIVIAEHTLNGAEYGEMRDVLAPLGFDIVEMSAESHDKHLAETLFLTHFIGQLITRAGFGRTEIDTVSYGFLMDAVESVRKDRALFRDVYRFNPHCKEVLSRISKAEDAVRQLLEHAGATSAELRIGVSGARGSFSEEAARHYAKKSGIRKFELSFLISVENVLAALERGEIDLGIFPIENSIGGIVTEAVKPMSKYNFKIKKVFDIDIRQNLLVRRGTKPDSVVLIASHEQALRQCRGYLRREWPTAKLRKYEDTAKAAEDLVKGKLSKSAAVIASRAAAEVYGLAILAAGIQDLKTNFTTFIAAVRR